jgi:co-chaperonin GroES (HSP10)
MVKNFHTVSGDIKPLKNSILVTDLEFGERKLVSGIIIPDDDGKDHGVRPRWGRVYAVGSEIVDVSANEWVLINHGRWTRGVNIEKEGQVITVRMIDPNDILLVSDIKPSV